MGSRRALLLLAAEGPDDEVVVSRKKLGRLMEETDRIRSDLEKEREERAKLRRELERKSRELEDRDRDLQRKQRELEKSRQTLERLKHKIAALQVATPSSKQLERPTMPAPAEPPPKGRRPGGQPGHPPHLRPRPDHVDESLDLTLDRCPDCDARLGESSDSYERFVTELIPAALFVLGLVVHRYWCRSCHRYVHASTDRALPGRQFGPRLASTLVLLSMMGLPVRKIQEVVLAMAGLSVSTGELQGLLEHTAKSLGPEYDAIREDVQSSYLVHPDETSMRVGGENWWARTFATKLSAYYVLDESRGADVVERVLGRDFPGTVVSDDWCAYNVLEGKRGVCWIHINRHLQAMEVRHGIRPRGPRDPSPPEYERAGRPPATYLRFARRLRATLREAVEWSKRTPEDATERRERKARGYERRIRRLCDLDSRDEDVARISKGLLRRMPHLFTFVRDARIPWENNAGERAIRSVCLKRKMSGGLRSGTGAETYARLKTVHETAKRRGQDFLAIVREALTRTAVVQPAIELSGA